mmetsp:Transcript_4490/g.10476  ORF Transcript_4490/g.10476 Transcript_4490/m.10476 type:complete len:111 (-) Transcript_4490:1094-1426(-)
MEAMALAATPTQRSTVATQLLLHLPLKVLWSQLNTVPLPKSISPRKAAEEGRSMQQATVARLGMVLHMALRIALHTASTLLEQRILECSMASAQVVALVFPEMEPRGRAF